MSTEINTAMVDTYNVGIERLAEQMESKLVSRVRVESKPGKRNAFDQIGAVAARKRTDRHGAAPPALGDHQPLRRCRSVG